MCCVRVCDCVPCVWCVRRYLPDASRMNKQPIEMRRHTRKINQGRVIDRRTQNNPRILTRLYNVCRLCLLLHDVATTHQMTLQVPDKKGNLLQNAHTHRCSQRDNTCRRMNRRVIGSERDAQPRFVAPLQRYTLVQELATLQWQSKIPRQIHRIHSYSLRIHKEERIHESGTLTYALLCILSS